MIDAIWAESCNCDTSNPVIAAGDEAGEVGAEAEASAGASGAAKAAEVRAIIAALPTCVTREQCDTLAENFVLVQSKGTRKRMVRFAWAPCCFC